jgi:hypothetical protein
VEYRTININKQKDMKLNRRLFGREELLGREGENETAVGLIRI